jgi:hypothetical protein
MARSGLLAMSVRYGCPCTCLAVPALTEKSSPPAVGLAGRLHPAWACGPQATERGAAAPAGWHSHSQVCINP